MSELACFLIGPNGSGKTTVGRILANFLSLKFIDLDTEIEQFTGKKINDLWIERSKEEIEALEENILTNATSRKQIILATNAYSVLTEKNRTLLSSRGKIIYLSADPVNQYTRAMLSGRQSPLLLAANDKLNYLIDLTKKTEPLYNSIADFTITTDNYGIEEIVNKIIDYLHCNAYCA